MQKKPSFKIASTDKKVEFLLVTPFSNGSSDMVKFFPLRGRVLVANNNSAEKRINSLLTQGVEIKNIIFTHLKVRREYVKNLREKGMRVSFYGHGWFPYFTKHFDPAGFAQDSLLANSNLDSLDVDTQKIKLDIDAYKNKYMINKKTKALEIGVPYIVVVLQMTKDVTIKDGYHGFESWQKIVDFAYGLLNKGEILVIKAHVSQYGKMEKIVAPLNSILVQSKLFNHSILTNAELVVGVNSTMLYEASVLYHKPVLALGDSWFNAHPKAIKRCDINDPNIQRPIVDEDALNYRAKLFHSMKKIQTTPFIHNFGHNFIDMHYKASSITNIDEWFAVEDTNYLKGTPEEDPSFVLKRRRRYERHKYKELLKSPKVIRYYGKQDHSAKVRKQISRLNINSVCDIGCGNGKFCKRMKKQRCDTVIGVDFVFKNEGSDVQWINCYAHDIPIEDSSVEYATAFDCLEHILPEDIDLVLSEMNRISTKGCIVSVPYKQSPTKYQKQGLHPIVQNKEWWINKLSTLGDIVEWDENYFHITKRIEYV